MIGSLRGVVDEVVELGDCVAVVVIDVGGVGYLVSVPTRTAVALGPPGSTARLSVSTQVRDTAITLYGFGDRTERRCFEVLLSTHGVGPALALAVLGAYRPEELARIVAGSDEAALTAVPGVGRKTAARLLVELGSRVEDLTGGVVFVAAGASGEGTALAAVGEALAALGYSTDEVRPVLQGLRELPGDDGPENLLRHALRELAGQR